MTQGMLIKKVWEEIIGDDEEIFAAMEMLKKNDT